MVGLLRVKRERLERAVAEQKDRLALNTKSPWAVGTLCQKVELARTPSTEELFHEACLPSDATAMTTYVMKLGSSTRSQYWFPNSGLVKEEEMKVGALLAIHQHSHVPIEALPDEWDPRAKAMEVEKAPEVTSADLGGLHRPIQELQEMVASLKQPEKFAAMGIQAPKGALLYGPPGTGKTLLARMVAAEAKATFLRLSGTALLQMYIGEGAKIVRDAFELARSKAPAIVFIDEIDSVGKKRSGDDSDRMGNREVSRTLMELLNQLDGFKPSASVKVLAATNRVDVLDPALIRSGRLDRKVEVPLPDLDARQQIMRIHARRMRLAAGPGLAGAPDWPELAAETEGWSAAECRALPIEAGMAALAKDAPTVAHHHFLSALALLRNSHRDLHSYFV